MNKKYAEVKPVEGFDWESFESGKGHTQEELKAIEEQYASTVSTVQEGDIIEGRIESKNNREFVVNVGLKTNGIINATEFRYNSDLEAGDNVEVMVKSLEGKNGQPILSHKEACQARAWDKVNAALESQEIVKGYIHQRTRGGMIVDIFGIDAFLPGSQIDVKPIRDFDEFLNKTMEFRIIKVNHEYRNVVISHKALIEEELEAQRSEIISRLEKGQVLEGVVKNITSYGAFIDLGGVDGLIHITDLSWGRIRTPDEVVQLDQKLNVVILDFDEDRKRIALGLKQLETHPWESLDANLSVGDKVTGKVVVITDYGAFVEILPGVEGLIHVSEMSWTQHIRSAHDFLKVGQEVEAMVITLDREERKMSLGMKQLVPDPWQDIEEKYPVGSRHTAKVRNFTNFGIFVEITDGIDGLIHISDLSWTKKIKHPSEFTQIGAEIEVVVLEIDKENRRLSMGHKQLEADPWESIASKYPVGSVHKGHVSTIQERGSVVFLEEGVEAFATPKHLVKEDGSSVQENEELSFKVIELNRENRRLIVSHSRVFEDEAKAQKAEQNAKAKAEYSAQTAEKSTLGDLGA